MKRFFIFGLLFSMAGCINTPKNIGDMKSFPIPVVESDWIRNGEPIVFEDESWFPIDDTESLADAEVYLMGEYNDVQFFVEKEDVRPYSRIYTKYGRNKFRTFEKKAADQ